MTASFSAYPQEIKYARIPSSNTLPLGGFFVTRATEINAVVLYMVRFGTAGGSETLTLKVYGHGDYTAPIASSAALTVSSFQGIVGVSTNWVGWARFSFSSPVPVGPDRHWLLGLVAANYTPSSSYFIGAQFDTHKPFNQPAWGQHRDIIKFRIEEERQWPAP